MWPTPQVAEKGSIQQISAIPGVQFVGFADLRADSTRALRAFVEDQPAPALLT